MYLFSILSLTSGFGPLGLSLVNKSIPCYEIGYWCNKKHQGQGFVQEAVMLLSRVAIERIKAQRVSLLGGARIRPSHSQRRDSSFSRHYLVFLQKVIIVCDEDNARSARVAERCGFKLDGTHRNAIRKNNGQMGNQMIFSLVPSDLL